MITLNAFEARLMRNKLRELSCESYVENEPKGVRSLIYD
jgi:hypothetical protein